MACLCSDYDYLKAKSKLEYLQSIGLITVTEDLPYGECNVVKVVVSLTSEGRKFFVSEGDQKFHVKTCELCFGEITGIQTQEQLKSAKVNYTLVRKNTTPFGKDISLEPLNYTEIFNLFDDGWRIN
jgi:hypothetical protein